jgi:phenylacetate-CoA ligase
MTGLSPPRSFRTVVRPEKDARHWDPGIQLMPQEQLRDLRVSRIQATIERMFERNVGFFTRRLEAVGIKTGSDVRSLDDLNSIPTFTKQDLRDSQSAVPPFGDFLSAGRGEAVRIGSSTGTTGAPVLTLYTEHDVWVENETFARREWRKGLRPGMVVTTAHPAYLYSGGFSLVGAFEYLGCLCLWVPPPDSPELAAQGIAMWQRIPPDIPFASFSLARFHEAAVRMGLDPGADLNLPDLPAGRPADGLPLITAGTECHSFLGGPCDESGGAHLADDYTFVQALDPETGHEVADGEWGRMVVTTFGKDNSLLRYDLHEACRVVREQCSCGETSSRGWWGGRLSDLLRVAGKSIWVHEIEGVLGRFQAFTSNTLEFTVRRPSIADDSLSITVEASAESDSAATEAAAVASARLLEVHGVRATVRPVAQGSLPRSAFKVNRIEG